MQTYPKLGEDRIVSAFGPHLILEGYCCNPMALACQDTVRLYLEQALDRKVEVDWDARIGETFPVRLVVYGHDRTSLLADIARVIAMMPPLLVT